MLPCDVGGEPGCQESCGLSSGSPYLDRAPRGRLELNERWFVAVRIDAAEMKLRTMRRSVSARRWALTGVSPHQGSGVL
jgi:hypothetical protein